MADDDELLIEAVRDGLAHRTGDLEIPSGMGQRGRRIAQRRSARRAGVIAVPVLVVAVVAAVLLQAGGRNGARRAIDAREVIREVSAQVAQVSRSGGVLETITSSADPGIPHMVEWEYTDLRNGITYDLMRYANPRGKLTYLYWNRARQLSGGRIENTALDIYASRRTWTIEHGVTPAPSSSPGIQSTARQIGRALRRGNVTFEGRATLQGRAVLKLQLHYHIRHSRYDLYVDPHTYRPIEQLARVTSRGRTVTSRIYLRPATAANIAHTVRRPTIPRGFKYFKTRTLPARYPSYHK